MKLNKIFFLILMLAGSLTFASGKKVLVEIFTNSHCPVCLSAHQTMDQYLQSANAENITYIYYHMVYPYPDDQLNLYNQSDASSRDSYYGPYGSTPQGFFDGEHQSSTYSNWGNILDTKIQEDSPFELSISGIRAGNTQNIVAHVHRTGSVSTDNLVVRFVVVESVGYSGRNGIAFHKNVMRKMVPSPSGVNLTLDSGGSAEVMESFELDPIWDITNLGIVVFIQNESTHEVYQSEYADIEGLTTDIKNENSAPTNFSLKQNYPNPFNPSTTINFTIAKGPSSLQGEGFRVGSESPTTLKVYDLLGNEVATLVDKRLAPGTYEYTFDGKNLSSGIYLYKLSTPSFVQTKKMILLK